MASETMTLEDREALDVEVWRRVFGEKIPDNYDPSRLAVPPFSSKIAAAWSVVERMKTLGHIVHMTDYGVPADRDEPLSGAVVVFTHRKSLQHGRTNGLDSLTAAGICRAALAALGEQSQPRAAQGEA